MREEIKLLLKQIDKAIGANSIERKQGRMIDNLQENLSKDVAMQEYLVQRGVDAIARLFEGVGVCAAIAIENVVTSKITGINITFNEASRVLRDYGINKGALFAFSCLRDMVAVSTEVVDKLKIEATSSMIKKAFAEFNHANPLQKAEMELTILPTVEKVEEQINIHNIEEFISFLFEHENNFQLIVDKLIKSPELLTRKYPEYKIERVYELTRAYVDWQKFEQIILPRLSHNFILNIIANPDKIHAELVMAELFPDRYIGISKLSCFFCFEYLLHQGREGAVRGSHGIISAKWVIPESASLEVLAKMKESLVKVLESIGEEGEYADSVIGSMHLHNISDDEDIGVFHISHYNSFRDSVFASSNRDGTILADLNTAQIVEIQEEEHVEAQVLGEV